MMSSISLPYYADPKDLPCRLPTKEEIESSKDILSDQTARIVVGVGPHFVVKYGIAIDPTEGGNILFVRQNTSIPVPRLYAVYTDSSDCKTYIVMERIVGHSLASLWPQMSEAEKAVISKNLREIMDQLRRVPSPEGRYCSLGNRGLMDWVFWTGDSTNTLFIEGPFDTEDELNSAMIKKYLFNCGLREKATFYEHAFPQIFRGHPPVFTHGDFQRKNIVVRKHEFPDARSLKDRELVLIDWEFSGWYPSYWELGKALYSCGGWDDDWHRYLAKILDEYLVEWAYLSNLFRELWS
jgi:hypothetical protein